MVVDQWPLETGGQLDTNYSNVRWVYRLIDWLTQDGGHISRANGRVRRALITVTSQHPHARQAGWRRTSWLRQAELALHGRSHVKMVSIEGQAKEGVPVNGNSIVAVCCVLQTWAQWIGQSCIQSSKLIRGEWAPITIRMYCKRLGPTIIPDKSPPMSSSGTCAASQWSAVSYDMISFMHTPLQSQTPG